MTGADIDRDVASARGSGGNDPRLMLAALPADDPDAARLAAEIARLDAAVARMTQGLGFYEEPAHYAAAQRRLA